VSKHDPDRQAVWDAFTTAYSAVSNGKAPVSKFGITTPGAKMVVMVVEHGCYEEFFESYIQYVETGDPKWLRKGIEGLE